MYMGDTGKRNEKWDSEDRVGAFDLCDFKRVHLDGAA